MGFVIFSPCTGKCFIESDACVGCGRFMYEISGWRYMDDEGKLAVLERLSESKCPTTSNE